MNINPTLENARTASTRIEVKMVQIFKERIARGLRLYSERDTYEKQEKFLCRCNNSGLR